MTISAFYFVVNAEPPTLVLSHLTCKVSDGAGLRLPGDPRRAQPALTAGRLLQRHPGAPVPVQQQQLPLPALHHRQQPLQRRLQDPIRE